MIIWQGLGILVVFIPVAYLVAVLGIVFGLQKPELIYLGTAFAMALSTFTIWSMGKKLNNSEGKVLIDPETNEKITIKNKHSLFWIPMQWFAIPALLLTLIAIGFHFL